MNLHILKRMELNLINARTHVPIANPTGASSLRANNVESSEGQGEEDLQADDEDDSSSNDKGVRDLSCSFFNYIITLLLFYI